MKKRLSIFFILMIFCSALVSAQSHNAVNLDDTVLYDFLEQAELRGYASRLPAAKPYPLSFVKSVLEDIRKKSGRMSAWEKEVFQELYDKYAADEDRPVLKDGDLRLDHDLFPVRIEAFAGAEANANLLELRDSGGEVTAGVAVTGDLADNFSWGVEFSGGAFLADDYDSAASYGPTAWEPYTYSKNWDGGLHPLTSLNNFTMMPTELCFGYSYDTEIAASFWDNALDFRFGRTRRDWGIGEGSLFLDGNARPFLAFEGSLSPWKWFNFSFLTGTLEYGENFRNADDYNIKGTSRTQQNMFSILQLEITPTDWLYLSAFDSGVFLKRPEMGYWNPLLSNFFNQNNVGDFDNMAVGGTLGVKIPGIAQTYVSVFLDEARFNHPDFFGNYSNMYSYQAGVKAPVPGLPWSQVILQYTKIEPFTYTHYAVDNSPWYMDLPMQTGYLNGGEGLGYGLEPNSDELMLKFRTLPRRGITGEAGYRMVRHGTGPGSTYDSWGYDSEDENITPDNDPNGAYGQEGSKNFLKDGVYEWFHIFSLGGTLDLSRWDQPVSFGLKYSYVYKYFSDYENNGNYSPVNSGIYENEHRHLVSFSVRLFP